MAGLEIGWGNEKATNMNETTHGVMPTPADSLHAELLPHCQRLAKVVNAELTRLYTTVGQQLRDEVLSDARAKPATR